jgi:hypothetical protein
MTSYRVFRDIPGRQRQYLRRIAGPALYLWHADVTLALPVDAAKAKRLALWFQVSSRRLREDCIWKNYQPAGKYNYEEATP